MKKKALSSGFSRCCVFAAAFFILQGVDGEEPSTPYYHGVFRDLPISDITPKGWLAEVLGRQRDGLGHHHEVSGDPFDTSMWVGTMSRPSWDRYEQAAYLIDGLYRCGLLLQDKELTGLGRANIEYVLTHPQADGKLGPANLGPITAKLIGLSKIDGKLPATQWPFAVFTRALMAHYEVTKEKAILDALTKHYLAQPENFGLAPRDVNNLEGMCWLYGKTGDVRLSALAERTWKNAASSPNENAKLKAQWDLNNMRGAAPMVGHGVSITEQSKQPALLYLMTGKREYLEASLGAFRSMERDHELVDGVVSSDEGLHGKTAESVHETCVISDYTWSLGYLLEADGGARWADKIERAVLNAGLGAIDKEFKAHQYFSSPNQVIATQDSLGVKAKYPAQHLNRQAYRPEFITQCCTGNVHRIFPNYAARMWLSDGNGGIAAALYGPSVLTTQAGAEKVPVTITQTTDYPFEGKIDLKITCDRAVSFPLHVRIPGWAEGSTVLVNGQPWKEKPVAGTFLTIDRSFANGDTVTLDFPMSIRMERPVPGGISLVRGPLVYSLRVKEDREAVGQTRKKNPDFPAWNLRAGSPWNYSLDLQGAKDLKKVKVVSHPVREFPWTASSSPVVLSVPARRVPSWQLTPDEKNPSLPSAPFHIGSESEEVELVPLGATMLRVTIFPSSEGKSEVANP